MFFCVALIHVNIPKANTQTTIVRPLTGGFYGHPDKKVMWMFDDQEKAANAALSMQLDLCKDAAALGMEVLSSQIMIVDLALDNAPEVNNENLH